MFYSLTLRWNKVGNLGATTPSLSSSALRGALFWIHLAIIVGGLFMGLVLPLWLVALLVVVHRFHLFLFDGCIFSRFQSRLGALDPNKNFLQEVALVLLKKEISKKQAQAIDRAIIRFSIAIAAVASMVTTGSYLSTILILSILSGLNLSWKMYKANHQKNLQKGVCPSNVCQVIKQRIKPNLVTSKAEVLGVGYFFSLIIIYGLISSGIASYPRMIFVAITGAGLVASVYYLYLMISSNLFCRNCLQVHLVSALVFVSGCLL